MRNIVFVLFVSEYMFLLAMHEDIRFLLGDTYNNLHTER